jgi:hypothetical protein
LRSGEAGDKSRLNFLSFTGFAPGFRRRARSRRRDQNSHLIPPREVALDHLDQDLSQFGGLLWLLRQIGLKRCLERVQRRNREDAALFCGWVPLVMVRVGVVIMYLPTAAARSMGDTDVNAGARVGCGFLM